MVLPVDSTLNRAWKKIRLKWINKHKLMLCLWSCAQWWHTAWMKGGRTFSKFRLVMQSPWRRWFPGQPPSNVFMVLCEFPQIISHFCQSRCKAGIYFKCIFMSYFLFIYFCIFNYFGKFVINKFTLFCFTSLHHWERKMRIEICTITCLYYWFRDISPKKLNK